jgi:hypothetical protein
LGTIIHILVTLVVAILRGFASALLLLCSRAALGVLGVTGIIGAALGLTGTLGASIRRRRD